MTAAVSASADLPTVEHSLKGVRGANSIFGIFKGSKSTSALGLLQNAVLPSFGLHGGLSIIAYGIARMTDRVELKDYLWPSGMLLNAWWTAVGRPSFLGSGASRAIDVFRSLSYAQKFLLGAVTAWGARLFYHIVKRSLARGKDDARYEQVKFRPGFWNKASLLFGLEAVFQTVISLPFTLPFRTDSLSGFTGAPAEWAGIVRWTAAGIFAAGLALETLADWQLDVHKDEGMREKDREKEREKEKKKRMMKQGKQNGEVLKTGVWSIVRHPNYLGDFLVHLAFPLWNFGSQLFTWPQLLAPAANYFFLRWIGGDRQNEASQVERYSQEEDGGKYAQLELYRLEKHSFWPSIVEIANPWTWLVVGVGATAAAATYVYESRIVAIVTAANPTDRTIGEVVAGLQ